MTNRRWRFRLIVFLATMAALNGVVFWRFRDRVTKGYGDFAMLYTAGRIVGRGDGPRLYDAEVQLREQQQFSAESSGRRVPLPFNHPPFEALLYVPLARLPYLTAYWLWTAVNFGMLVSVVWLLRPYLDWLQKTTAAELLMGAAAYFPLGLAMWQGQDTFLLLLMLGLCWRDLRADADFRAGCWLAVGLIRPQIILPLAVLLAFERRGRFIAGFAAVAAALGAVSIAMIGWPSALRYPEFVAHAEKNFLEPGIEVRMPNLHGLLATMGGWLGSSTEGVVWATGLLSVTLMAIVVWVLRRGDRSQGNLDFSLAVIAALLVSYHAFEYDLTLLLLPMALIVAFVSEASRLSVGRKMALLGPIVLLFFSPLHFLLGGFGRQTSLLALLLLAWGYAVVGAVRPSQQRAIPL